MFKTKGFSSNSSLKRRAIIVDAPDLPPNECEFFITAAGVADTEKVEIPDEKGLDFEVETLYEESEETETFEKSGESDVALLDVKGIGKGTVESLSTLGINSVPDLLEVDPEDLSSKLSGASSNKIMEWQNSAKKLTA